MTLPAQQLAEQLLIDAEDQECPPAPASMLRPGLLLLGLVLVALNLRPALSSLAPLLNEVAQSVGLSSAAAGLLTTLPVFCLGLFAPLAPILARRFGAERVVLGFLLVLAGGIGLRSLFGIPGLFLGSLLAGASIGIVGVLLPGIIKRDFPRQAGSLTGVYTMALCLGAAAAAGATVPLSEYWQSWAMGLAFWALPAIIAALCWLPQTAAPAVSAGARVQVRGLWRDPLAWQITLYLGLQSSLAYIVFGWLPSILIGRGLSPLEAGLMLSGSVLVQLLSALSAPWLATRGRDQRLAIALALALTLTGLLGCLYSPVGGLWGFAVVLGLGQGATFSLALSLIVLRTPDSHVASQLSSMAQGVGYTLAGFGPLAVGLLHDWSGDWSLLGGLFVLVSVLALVFGMGAGRDRLVAVRAEPL